MLKSELVKPAVMGPARTLPSQTKLANVAQTTAPLRKRCKVLRRAAARNSRVTSGRKFACIPTGEHTFQIVIGNRCPTDYFREDRERIFVQKKPPGVTRRL
jgi:hypothetical protein